MRVQCAGGSLTLPLAQPLRLSACLLQEMEQLDSISSNSQGTSPFEAGTLAECSEDYDPHQSNHTQVYSGMQA